MFKVAGQWLLLLFHYGCHSPWGSKSLMCRQALASGVSLGSEMPISAVVLDWLPKASLPHLLFSLTCFLLPRLPLWPVWGQAS
jgi:hypothetical protein